MHSTAIDRRHLLGLLAGGISWPLLPLRLRAEVRDRLYISGRGDGNGGFLVSAFTEDGRPVFDLPMPARGHSFAVQPGGGSAVHFARRPGNFAEVIDLRAGKIVREIDVPDDRRFYGHGVYSPDGKLLYATENDFENARGVLGIYDATDGYRRIGELPTHGVGPHDVRLLSDGETMVVANGGIHTRPDLPRVKLNIPTMAPSLVYLDRRDGTLLQKVELGSDLNRLGIRHVSVAPDDSVAVAMQYEGAAGDIVPLVGGHRRRQDLQLFDAPFEVLRGMKHYCGSLAFDTGGKVVAVSSPRGHVMTFWDVRSGQYIASADVPDGCGVAPGSRPGEFLASSGQGGVLAVDAHSGTTKPIASDFLAAGHWDNHIALSVS